MSGKTCFQIAENDNVAVVLADARQGEVIHNVGSNVGKITLLEDINYAHKVALLDISMDEPVTKYGITIGIATQNIKRGELVHLHNCASVYDERSASFDPKTGAPTETAYE